MHPELSSLVPRDKMDTDKADAIVALGYPKVAPILPALVGWMQDMNWPVARLLQPFLANIGAPLAPHIRAVLNSNDDIWKFWTLRFIVAESAELAALLKPELYRLASSSTVGEQAEEVDVQAKEILRSLS